MQEEEILKMARANRGAAAAAAADVLVYDAADAAAAAAAAAAENAPAAAGAGAPAGPSAVQISAAALSELTASQFVAFVEEKGQRGPPIRHSFVSGNGRGSIELKTSLTSVMPC